MPGDEDDKSEKKTSAQQSVRDWLAKEGYPLEFRVAHAAGRAKFAVQQGFHAPDPSGKVREVDVVARLTSERCPRAVEFALAIECKAGTKHPWVVFSNDVSLHGSQAAPDALGTMFARAIIEHGSNDRRVFGLGFFKSGPRSGFGLAEAHKPRDKQAGDQAYRGLQSLVSNVTSWLDSQDDSEAVFASRAAIYVHPLIVVEAPLFEVYFIPDKGLEVSPITRARLLWHGAAARGGRRTIVDVVNADSLGDYLAEAHTYGARALAFLEEGVLEFERELKVVRANRGHLQAAKNDARSAGPTNGDAAEHVLRLILAEWKLPE